METKLQPIIRIVRGSEEADYAFWQVRAQTETGAVMASVKLRSMLECPCVGIMFHLETLEDYQRKGLAETMLRELESLAISSSISLLIATVRVYNTPCRTLLEKLGWICACQWLNTRTGNDLVLYRKVLNLSLDS